MSFPYIDKKKDFELNIKYNINAVYFKCIYYRQIYFKTVVRQKIKAFADTSTEANRVKDHKGN